MVRQDFLWAAFKPASEVSRSVPVRVGYRLNFIDSDSDSAYQFRLFSIPSFDSNGIK